MSWTLVPLATPLMLGGALLVGVSAVATARRHTRAATSLALLTLAVAVYVLGYAVELGAADPAAVLLCLRLEYLGLAFVPPLMLAMALAHTGHRQFLHPLPLAVLFVVPVVTVALAWSDQHTLIWRELRLDQTLGFTRTRIVAGPWYGVQNAYLYVVAAATLGALGRALLHTAGLLRRQLAVLICAVLLPLGVHVVYLVGDPFSGLDPNPFALLGTALILAWAVLRSALLHLVPVARDAVFASQLDAVLVADAADRLVDANPAAGGLLSVPLDEAIGQPLARVFPLWEEIVGEHPVGEPFQTAAQLNLPRGPAHFTVSAAPLALRRGRVEGRVLTLRDSTAQHEAEEALRASESRFRALLETAPDAIIISDQQGRIALANHQAEILLGYGAGQLAGREVEELVPERLRAAHRGHRAAYDRAPVRRAMGSGRDLVVLHRDGHEVPVEISLAPVRTGSGALVTTILRDLTETRRVEEQLRLRGTALEAAANAVVLTDRDGRVLWANPAFTRLTGWALDEVLGRSTSLLRSGAHDQAFYAQLWQTVTAGRVWHGEMINRRKDGTLYAEEQTIAPVTDERGLVTHFVAIKQDITERKEVERLREDLVGTLVHDLRNPLTIIRGALEMLPAGERGAARELLDPAQRAVGRLLDLVSSLLDVHALSTGRQPLERGPVDLAALVGDAVAMQAPLAREKGLQFRAELAPGLPPLSADARLLSRVLQNLLGNALKFTPAGGAIRVSVARSAVEGELEVRVADDGPGIPPELRPRLFREFVRGSGEQRGSGLGLAFCRGAVEAHGGRIWVDSEPGRGAVFAFALPMPPATPGAAGSGAQGR